MRAKLKVILPFLLFVYILAEIILKANNIELCSSTGCALAGDLLKFNSIYLNYLGMAGALALFILALIKGELAQKLYSILLISMLFFESLLIASQINLNPEPCKFCLGVYAFLIIMAINDNAKRFLALLPAIAAIFVAFSILAIPKNKSIISKDGLYLIASKTCPHCKEAKKFLDSNNIEYKTISSKDLNAFYVAKTLSIKKIPIAIKKEENRFEIFVGVDEIKRAFKKQKSKIIPIQEKKVNYYKENDEGCTLSIFEESSCEQGIEDGK